MIMQLNAVLEGSDRQAEDIFELRGACFDAKVLFFAFHLLWLKSWSELTKKKLTKKKKTDQL
jgi:hypothetical protein